MPVLQTPKLEAELVAAADQREKAIDTALSTLQKGIMTVITAMLPVAALMLEHGEADSDLDELSGNLLDSFCVLASTLLNVATRCRDNLKMAIHADYAKLVHRKSDNPEWLFGGKLVKTTRQCEMTPKLTEKI